MEVGSGVGLEMSGPWSTFVVVRVGRPLSSTIADKANGGGSLREYRDVTPLEWGERYDAKIFVSRESMRLLGARY